MANVDQSLTLTQQSQSIENNYSVVRILWTSKQDSDSYNNYTRTAKYYVTINGVETEYSVSYTLPRNTTKTILDVTMVVPHNDNGTGQISVRTWMDTRISAGVVELSKTLVLTTIPRLSKLSVPNGYLSMPQILTVTKQSDAFTHSISYVCASTYGIICNRESATSIHWTPPYDLANHAPQSNSLSVIFTITTFYGDAVIGSTSTTATYTLPDLSAFNPIVAISTSDPTGYADYYGGYVQGQSKLKLDITTYGAYSAWINSCKTTFDGKTYTKTSFTSDLISNSGTLTATIVSTDSRERSTTATKDISVLEYEYPKISSLSAFRSDANGSANSTGAYITIRFSSKIYGLNGKNGAWYKVEYKKSNATEYAEERIEVYTGQFDVQDGTFTFPAEETSYDVILSVGDRFRTTPRAVIAPSVKKVWSMLKKYGEIVSLSIGKIADPALVNVFDIGWKTKFSGGILHPTLPDRTDLNTLLLPTTYILLSANSYTNAPENAIGAFLEIWGIEATTLTMRYSVFDRANPRVYERIYYTSTGWGDWRCVRGDFVVEQGLKDGWYYRKWNSGTAECWTTVPHTTTITTSWGALYHGTATNRINYPFVFTDKPLEVVSLTAGSYQGILFPEKNGNGVNGAAATACYNICRPSSITTSSEFYINYFVTGKWK